MYIREYIYMYVDVYTYVYGRMNTDIECSMVRVYVILFPWNLY